MSLQGTGFRHINTNVIPEGFPYGGSKLVTFALVPTGTYPANGELISDIFAAAAAEGAHIPVGVKPDNVFMGSADSLGHVWSLDKEQGTMGSLRNWTAIGNTPTEHVTGAYAGNETSAVLTISFLFPAGGILSR